MKNKITKGQLCNTIDIHKPVTMREWEKVRDGKTTKDKEQAVARSLRHQPPLFLNPVVIPPDPTDEEVLQLALYNIAKLEPKFRDGMKKYSTSIFQKSGLKEMLPEILDLISYHAVAQLQWSRVHRLLDDLCIENPGLDKNRLVRKMFEILGDKPLAVKKKIKKK